MLCTLQRAVSRQQLQMRICEQSSGVLSLRRFVERVQPRALLLRQVGRVPCSADVPTHLAPVDILGDHLDVRSVASDTGVAVHGVAHRLTKPPRLVHSP